MGFLSPKMPKPIPPPAPATLAGGTAQESAAQVASRAAAANGAGFEDTLKTGPEGAATPNTADKKLLGE